MVVTFRFLSVALVLALFVAVGGARAGDGEDAQVERGVAFYDDGDFEQAKAILLPLAEAGHPEAMNVIGLMHYDGIVFPKNAEVECDWYERAANAGDSWGMYNLSICYNQGEGRAKDLESMLYWRTLGAENGSINAMINLAGLDEEQGDDYRYWMNQAVDHGSVYAQVSLWLQGYKQDVPDIKARDIACVLVLILTFDGSLKACD